MAKLSLVAVSNCGSRLVFLFTGIFLLGASPRLLAEEKPYENKRFGVRFEVGPSMKEVSDKPPGAIGRWRSVVNGVSIRIEIRRYEDVSSLLDYVVFIRDSYRKLDPEFEFTEQTGIDRNGVPGVEVGIADEKHNGFTLLHLFFWKNAGVEVATTVPLEAAESLRPVMKQILERLSLLGKPPDPKWSKDEFANVAKVVFPGSKSIKPVRSKHYIVFSDGPAARKVAALFEKKVYPLVKKILKFDETGKERLLPIYVFRDHRDYIDFYMKVARLDEFEQASLSVCYAFSDGYATSDDQLGHNAHYHEGLHQIVFARLQLAGGGQWFHEGLAEYVKEQVEKRNLGRLVAAAVDRGDALPLRELMTLREFVARDLPANAALARGQALYDQSASLFLFLREDKRVAKKFLEFINRAGTVLPGNLESLEKVFVDLYGWTLDEFEAEWKKFLARS